MLPVTGNSMANDVEVVSSSAPYVCPISQCPIRVAVKNAACGHLYDAGSLAWYMQSSHGQPRQRKCPIAGCSAVLDPRHPPEIDPSYVPPRVPRPPVSSILITCRLPNGSQVTIRNVKVEQTMLSLLIAIRRSFAHGQGKVALDVGSQCDHCRCVLFALLETGRKGMSCFMRILSSVGRSSGATGGGGGSGSYTPTPPRFSTDVEIFKELKAPKKTFWTTKQFFFTPHV